MSLATLIWLYLALFAAGCYMQVRVEMSYSAYTKLGRPPALPHLATMALSPRHQLRWTASQWSRWASSSWVLL